MKQYKKLPNTFVYLFAYFLLADVRATSIQRRHSNADISGGLLPGHKHTYDASSNMSNFPVQVLFLGFYVPRSRSTRCGNYWNSRVLEHAALLEDGIEEDGKAPSRYFPLNPAADMEVQFLTTCVTATALSLWGMVGIWVDNFGWVVRVHSSPAEK